MTTTTTTRRLRPHVRDVPVKAGTRTRPHQVSCYVPRGLWARAMRLARRRGLSSSELVRRLLEAELERVARRVGAAATKSGR